MQVLINCEKASSDKNIFSVFQKEKSYYYIF